MFSKKILLLFVIFVLIRVYFIVTFPPYTDESLYIRWGQLMVHNPELRWASFTYVSRQPLAFWLFGLGAIIFHNPLVGARLVMLIVNIPSFFLMYALAKKIFDEKNAVISVALFAFSPIFVLLQSLAIMDGFLLPIAVAILFIFANDWKKNIYIPVLGICLLLGLSIWIKTTALLLFALSCMGCMWKFKTSNKNYASIIVCASFLLTVPALLAFPMMLGRDAMNMLREPGGFMLTPSEFLNIPIRTWITNIAMTSASIFLYLNPLTVLSLITHMHIQNRNTLRALIAWAIIPILIYMCIGKNFQTRYFLFALPALIPIMAAAIANLEKIYGHRLNLLIVLYSITAGFAIFFVTMPVKFFSLFPIHSLERDYALSWPSGYGLPELVSWIDKQQSSAYEPIRLVVADSPGNPSDFLLATYYFNPRVQILITAISTPAELEKLRLLAESQPIYLATRSTLITNETKKYFVPVKLFPKPDTDETVGIYKIVFNQ